MSDTSVMRPDLDQVYYRSLLKGQLTHYQQDLGVDRLVNGTRLVQFFAARNSLLVHTHARYAR